MKNQGENKNRKNSLEFIHVTAVLIEPIYF